LVTKRGRILVRGGNLTSASLESSLILNLLCTRILLDAYEIC
jgi:hypothetical protein